MRTRLFILSMFFCSICFGQMIVSSVVLKPNDKQETKSKDIKKDSLKIANLQLEKETVSLQQLKKKVKIYKTKKK